MADSKKPSFSIPPIDKILYGHQALKQAKNTQNAFLASFRAYVVQPDDHIGQATYIYVGIYPTHLMTNP